MVWLSDNQISQQRLDMYPWHKLLSFPTIYKLAMRALGGHACRARFVDRYMLVQPGDRILDLGCGPGDLLDYLPAVDYVGIDVEPKYIASARNRHGERGTFLCNDVVSVNEEGLHQFDIIVASALIHHLSDDECIKLFHKCRRLLKENGRMVTLDGCRVPGQHMLDKWMLDLDRGEHVRTLEGYMQLATSVFPNVQASLHSNLLRIPYTHIVMELSLSLQKRGPHNLKLTHMRSM